MLTILLAAVALFWILAGFCFALGYLIGRGMESDNHEYLETVSRNTDIYLPAALVN